MQQMIHKKKILALPALLLAVLISIIGIVHYVHAANAVAIANIDYDNMELTINMEQNTIVYYSTNKSKWIEVDGAIETVNHVSTMTFDISWLSASGNTTLYFRGNKNKTTCPITIPGYNKNFKAKFDKSSGQFEFTNTDGAEVLRWRKTTDYTWHYIWADTGKSSVQAVNASTYPAYSDYGVEGVLKSIEDFEKEISSLRVKGAKLIFQTAPKRWTVNNQGARPSKDVKVTVAAKKSAPNVKVNIKKLTVNTTTKMEWTAVPPSAVKEADWKPCTKAMPLSELAKAAVDGVSEVTVYFRTAATSSVCASKIATLTVPKRENAPSAPAVIAQIPGKEVGKSKATLTFSNVPSQGYEYAVVKTGILDETKASWKKVKKAKAIKFSEKSLPGGAKVYIRVSGVTANLTKGIKLQLPSKHCEMTVPAYPTTNTTVTDPKKP